jgi:RNA recognition motif-containing protein
VSNLPYTATSTDLKTLFSDIAPVRSAFVVLDHGTSTSKGVGYVSFAIPEDAKAAFNNCSADGIILDGRKLRVEWAANKVCLRVFPLKRWLSNVGSSPVGKKEEVKPPLPLDTRRPKQLRDLRVTYQLLRGILLPSALSSSLASPLWIQRASGRNFASTRVLERSSGP